MACVMCIISTWMPIIKVGEYFKRNWDWDEFQVRWNRFLGSNIERNWECLDVSMDSGLFGSYNYVAVGIERNV